MLLCTLVRQTRRLMMKNFFIAIPKVLFAIVCYLCALLMALLSGYFTIIFYSQSQSGWNMWAMGGLAGMLEFIKILLAASYPFIQYRDIKRERKLLFYLKICYFLSIMASLNYFLMGGEIERSPASKITELLYDYMPIFSIIPLKFSKFMTTMSLSILVEAFIIFLPILAPIMFLEKDYQRKRKDKAVTSMDKLKEIVTVIPERMIDRLHQKIVGPDALNTEQVQLQPANTQIEAPKEDIKIFEVKDKPTLKLLKSANSLKTEKIEKPPIEEENTKSNFDGYEDDEDTDNDSDSEIICIDETDKQKVLAAIYKYKDSNICPSVKQLMSYTGLKKSSIHIIKKYLEDSGILRTEGRKTILLCDYDKALEKLFA